MFSDYTKDKVNVAGPGVYKAMLLLSLAFVFKLVTTIFTFGIKVCIKLYKFKKVEKPLAFKMYYTLFLKFLFILRYLVDYSFQVWLWVESPDVLWVFLCNNWLLITHICGFLTTVVDYQAKKTVLPPVYMPW